ncbi:MAG: hypothetical protein FWD05_12750, partial [Oscillospiraceae bacterium]|nr:hypothetical protein [Oscillospiraceae bacterium]
MKIHRIIATSIIIAILAILVGCSNNVNNEATPAPSDETVAPVVLPTQYDYVFEAETIPFPNLPSGFDHVENITVANDMIY